MQPKPLLVLFGPSGSGKDFVYKLLRKNNPEFVKVSFSRPLKSILEQSLDLGPGELDTKAGKSQLVPNVFGLDPNTSFLELLVEAYRDSRYTIFEDIWPGIVRYQINQTWERGQIPVVTDARNEIEARALFTLEANAHVYQLSRFSSEPLLSDEGLGKFLTYVYTHNQIRMDNQIMLDIMPNHDPVQARLIADVIMMRMGLS